VLEAARVLASKLDSEKNQVEDKVIKAFRLIVCRKPTEKEVKLLSSYYNNQLSTFKKEQSRAEKLLAVGEYPMPTKMNKTSVAAMMQVITALYNLEETITKS
jgi:D-alanine-D-alanine ligase-like ATP-grasp enzyme